MKKLILSLCMVLVLLACKDEKKAMQANNKPIIKIGVIMSFTGAEPEGANNAKNALLFIKDKKLSSSPISYEFVFEDSRGEPAKGITVAKKLIDYDNVDVIFSNISAVSKSISPYIDASKVVHIAFSSDKETAKGDTGFVFWISAEEYADRMYQLLNKMNVKNIAAIVSIDATSEQRYDALQNLIKDSDIKLYKEEITPGTRDFRITISKILNKKPDLILLLAPLPELDIVAKQIREIGSDIMITSMDFINYSQHKELFEGSIYVSTNDGNTEIVNEIMEAISTQNPFALAYMNDVMMLLNEVIVNSYQKNKVIPKKEELAKALLKLKAFKGAVGEIIIKDGGIINPKAILKKIENGESVKVEE